MGGLFQIRKFTANGLYFDGAFGGKVRRLRDIVTASDLERGKAAAVVASQ